MTDGIEAVYLETHNWGKSARFFQKLGYTVEFETDHNSGQLRNGDGPYLFIAEVPDDARARHLAGTRRSPTRTHCSSTTSRS